MNLKGFNNENISFFYNMPLHRRTSDIAYVNFDFPINNKKEFSGFLMIMASPYLATLGLDIIHLFPRTKVYNSAKKSAGVRE